MPAQPPLVILSPEFPSYSRYQIGEYAWQLSQYLKLNLPLPETMMLPKTTIDQIVAANNRRSHSLGQFLIPYKIKLEIIKHYHQFLDGDFAKLYTDQDLGVSLNNIKGDANLIHSLIELLKTKFYHLDRPTTTDNQPNRYRTANRQNLTFNLFITRQPQADVSGIVYTHHPLAFSKSHYVIEAVAGVWASYPETNQKDIYQIDVRTKVVVRRQKRTKNLSYKRSVDGVVPAKSPIKTSQFLLSQPALKILTRLTQEAALHQFKPLKVYFSICQQRVFIEIIETIDPLHLPKQTKTQKTNRKLPLKVNVHLNLAQELDQILPQPDGVIYSAKQALLSFNTYPPALIQQKQVRLLKLLLDKQWQQLNRWLTLNPQKQVFAKLIDLNPSQLAKLHQAPTTFNEVNADWGRRGAYGLIMDHRLLEFELSVLAKNWPRSKTLNLILPLVRSAAELDQLIKLIRSLKLGLKINFWPEIATADPILTLDQWLIRKISGIYINTQMLQANLVGFDFRQQALIQAYDHQQLGLVRLLRLLNKKLKQQAKPLPVMLGLSSYHYPLVALAVDLHWQLATNKFLNERVRLALTDALTRKIKQQTKLWQ